MSLIERRRMRKEQTKVIGHRGRRNSRCLIVPTGGGFTSKHSPFCSMIDQPTRVPTWHMAHRVTTVAARIGLCRRRLHPSERCLTLRQVMPQIYSLRPRMHNVQYAIGRSLMGTLAAEEIH